MLGGLSEIRLMQHADAGTDTDTGPGTGTGTDVVMKELCSV